MLFDSRLTKELAANTPHLLNHGFKNRIPINVSGQARLTPGQAFALLRTASNSLHSLVLNRIFHGFRNALENPEKLEATAARFSPKELAYSAQDIAGIIAEVKDRKFGAFLSPHLMLLAHQAGLPIEPTATVLIQFNTCGETLRDGIAAAKTPRPLEIRLSARKTIVKGHGMGKNYPALAEQRLQGRTSLFLQKRAAKITRKLGPNQASTTLEFKQAA
ncbi:TPA: hypothetical protein HA318_04830 [Candidatus Micrarchaeota archaeon]|nr:MAG: hypothetical protein AUJ65_00345 [Candidatus Micrarchaeota archaeon CG1_02_51_15]HII39296.1 hypothetical protein [Candidatus Micrarchaeota archaeon]